MEAVFVIPLILLVVAVIVVAIYFGYQAQKKRREAMAALAAELGWSFVPEHDRSHDDEYAHFDAFRRGHSRAAYNTLRGNADISGRSFPAKMGDYTYKITRSSGKSSSTQTYRFSYLIVHLPFRGVPDLRIRREGFFDKVAGALGFDDIDFESAEFSRKYHVKSRDKRFAYDVITARMMAFLLDSEAGTIDIAMGSCCIDGGTRTWEPAVFKDRLGWMVDFFALWPEHVTTALESRAGGRS